MAAALPAHGPHVAEAHADVVRFPHFVCIFLPHRALALACVVKVCSLWRQLGRGRGGMSDARRGDRSPEGRATHNVPRIHPGTHRAAAPSVFHVPTGMTDRPNSEIGQANEGDGAMSPRADKTAGEHTEDGVR